MLAKTVVHGKTIHVYDYDAQTWGNIVFALPYTIGGILLLRIS